VRAGDTKAEIQRELARLPVTGQVLETEEESENGLQNTLIGAGIGNLREQLRKEVEERAGVPLESSAEPSEPPGTAGDGVENTQMTKVGAKQKDAGRVEKHPPKSKEHTEKRIEAAFRAGYAVEIPIEKKRRGFIGSVQDWLAKRKREREIRKNLEKRGY
ncbi:MAG: hypothetical protein U1C97_02985, partial [Candidatus Gracilibacteria bacterium]|nr:hypothetical protein [Candidatus Gracilibacteria bacterium]